MSGWSCRDTPPFVQSSMQRQGRYDMSEAINPPGLDRQRTLFSPPATTTGHVRVDEAEATTALTLHQSALVCGDACRTLQLLPDACVQTVVTSPPPTRHSRNQTPVVNLGARASRPQAGRRPATWQSGRDARAPRTRRFQRSGITETKAGRRTILRHFAQHFMGKGLLVVARLRCREPDRDGRHPVRLHRKHKWPPSTRFGACSGTTARSGSTWGTPSRPGTGATAPRIGRTVCG